MVWLMEDEEEVEAEEESDAERERWEADDTVQWMGGAAAGEKRWAR